MILPIRSRKFSAPAGWRPRPPVLTAHWGFLTPWALADCWAFAIMTPPTSAAVAFKPWRDYRNSFRIALISLVSGGAEDPLYHPSTLSLVSSVPKG